MAKTKPDPSLVCLWCGKITVPDTNAIPTEKTMKIIKSHDQICPKTPLAVKNQTGKEKI